MVTLVRFLDHDTLLTAGMADWRTILWIDFWEFPARHRIRRITNAPPPHFLSAFAFSPDGQWLVGPGGGQATKVWRVADGSLATNLTSAAFMNQASFSPDGRWLAMIGGVAGRETAVHLWNTATWTETLVLRGHTDPVTTADFSPDGQWLATGAGNGEVNLWPLAQTRDQENVAWFPEESSLTRAASDGSGFLRVTRAVSSNGVAAPAVAEAWSAMPLRRVITAPADGYGVPSSLVLIPGARAAALGGDDGSHHGRVLAGFTGPGDMGVWKIPSLAGPPMWRAHAPGADLTACAFSADARVLAAAIRNGELFLWDLTTRKRMVLPRTLAFSPDGSRLAAASDNEAKMFDAATGQEVLSFRQPGLQLAFTRDGEKLLAVNSKAAFLLEAPSLAQLQFGWLKDAW
jgi:WD40 repeat protein